MSLKVKAQLAEKAEQAAHAAEAALEGKIAMVEQLQEELKEAADLVEEQARSCKDSQTNLQAAMNALAQGSQLVNYFYTLSLHS